MNYLPNNKASHPRKHYSPILPGMVPSSNAGFALGSNPPARIEPSFSLK